MRILKTMASVLIAGNIAGAGVARAADLVIWMRTPSTLEAQSLKQIFAEFEAANPGTTIKLESRSVDEHKSALRIAATSRSGPDLYYMWTGLGLGGDYVHSGLSATLDDYYKKYQWMDRLRPLADQYSNLYPPGKHGVPYQINGQALYYNKVLFKKAGIDAPPQSYDALLAVAEKLRAAGIPAITFGGSVNWHLMRLMDVLLETQCGAQTHDALKAMTAKWHETPCAGASFAELHKWISDYTLKPFMSLDHAQSRRLFEVGRAAMMLEGDWLVDQLRTEVPGMLADVGVFPFPTGTNRLYGFGVNFYLNPYSNNHDLAAKFLDLFISDRVQQAHLGVFGAIGVNKNVTPKNNEPLDMAWFDMFAQFQDSFVNGDQAFPLDVATEYMRIINSVADQTLTPAQAPGALQSFIDQRAKPGGQ